MGGAGKSIWKNADEVNSDWYALNKTLIFQTQPKFNRKRQGHLWENPISALAILMEQLA
ncbi:hypothetical protein [Desulfotalea psychrophila]|uniref:hypothetical protein n=1 Tax=Desulfotalea psychrophila TaxID=84980 RepID=UPI0002FC06A2|nr:hypothetical protein [Desulfotalea psychrophila]